MISKEKTKELFKILDFIYNNNHYFQPEDFLATEHDITSEICNTVISSINKETTEEELLDIIYFLPDKEISFMKKDSIIPCDFHQSFFEKTPKLIIKKYITNLFENLDMNNYYFALMLLNKNDYLYDELFEMIDSKYLQLLLSISSDKNKRKIINTLLKNNKEKLSLLFAQSILYMGQKEKKNQDVSCSLITFLNLEDLKELTSQKKQEITLYAISIFINDLFNSSHSEDRIKLIVKHIKDNFIIKSSKKQPITITLKSLEDNFKTKLNSLKLLEETLLKNSKHNGIKTFNVVLEREQLRDKENLKLETKKNIKSNYILPSSFEVKDLLFLNNFDLEKTIIYINNNYNKKTDKNGFLIKKIKEDILDKNNLNINKVDEVNIENLYTFSFCFLKSKKLRKTILMLLKESNSKKILLEKILIYFLSDENLKKHDVAFVLNNGFLKLKNKEIEAFLNSIIKIMSKEEIIQFLTIDKKILNHCNSILKFFVYLLSKNNSNIVYELEKKPFIKLITNISNISCIEDIEHNVFINIKKIEKKAPNIFFDIFDKIIKEEYNGNNGNNEDKKEEYFFYNTIELNIDKIKSSKNRYSSNKSKKKISLNQIEYFIKYFFFCFNYEVFSFFVDYLSENYEIDSKETDKNIIINMINAHRIKDHKKRMDKLCVLNKLFGNTKSIYENLNIKYIFNSDGMDFKTSVSPNDLGLEDLLQIIKYKENFTDIMKAINERRINRKKPNILLIEEKEHLELMYSK